MSLEKLLQQGRIVRHKTSRKEVSSLIDIIKRDLSDAKVGGISLDRRFATAYNAILQSAMIAVHLAGFRPKGSGHHAAVFECLKYILAKQHGDLIDYFDSCRSKRNITDYDYAGRISRAETEEILKEAEKFFDLILKWVKQNHPEYI
ncbi:MAG: hypothetical protein HQL28_04825 [Candidatus Omnitrophica bacterium]|nr:hypothetical protein [Candidatus Omnitrophota bacterium]